VPWDCHRNGLPFDAECNRSPQKHTIDKRLMRKVCGKVRRYAILRYDLMKSKIGVVY